MSQEHLEIDPFTIPVEQELESYLWQDLIEAGIRKMLNDPKNIGDLPLQHTMDTPKRVVKALCEDVRGVKEDPADILKVTFPLTGGGMVIVKDILVHSLCAHHLKPFFGKAHFAYIPNDRIVGLSKIPRLVECFARRPQIQEFLCVQIINAFQNHIKPLGCGIVIDAVHTCMSMRGVRANGASTKTIELAGVFLKNSSVKQEFLEGIK